MANKKSTETSAPIVYSTNISDKIRKSYELYLKRKESFGSESSAARIAFHDFATACEKENKNYLTVISEL